MQQSVQPGPVSLMEPGPCSGLVRRMLGRSFTPSLASRETARALTTLATHRWPDPSSLFRQQSSTHQGRTPRNPVGLAPLGKRLRALLQILELPRRPNLWTPGGSARKLRSISPSCSGPSPAPPCVTRARSAGLSSISGLGLIRLGSLCIARALHLPKEADPSSRVDSKPCCS